MKITSTMTGAPGPALEAGVVLFEVRSEGKFRSRQRHRPLPTFVSCDLGSTPTRRKSQVSELLVDFITSLDGYGAAEGWPGWWGLEGPEYPLARQRE